MNRPVAVSAEAVRSLPLSVVILTHNEERKIGRAHV